MSREDWLSGHFRTGSGVLIGTGVHCAGCGKFGGITSVALDENYSPPAELPKWPFEEKDCPVCNIKRKLLKPTVDELSTLSQSILRQALIQAKKCQ